MLAMALSLALTAPAWASASRPIAFDTHKQLGPYPGTWSSSGAFVDSGSFGTLRITFSGAGAPGFQGTHVEYRFTGSDGTFDLHADMKERATSDPDVLYDDGTWELGNGTGSYNKIHGHGIVTGTVDEHDPDDRHADRTYSGDVHFD